MKKLAKWLKNVAAWPFGRVIPWFMTERVAMVNYGKATGEDDWDVLCREDELNPGEGYDALGTSRGIAWAGMMYSPSVELDEHD